MIDWWWVVRHALWIAGLAVLLATFSYRYWTSASAGTTHLVAGSSRFYLLGSLLVAAGGLLLSTELWRRGGWLLVIALLLWVGWSARSRG